MNAILKFFNPCEIVVLTTLSDTVCPYIKEAMDLYNLTIEEDGTDYLILIGDGISVSIALADYNSYILNVNDNPAHTRVSKEELNHLIITEIQVP